MKRNSTKLLQDLAERLVATAHEPLFGSDAAAPRLEVTRKTPEPGYLVIDGRELELFTACVDFLCSDPDLRHLSKSDIEEMLTDLAWDLSSKPVAYHDQVLRDRYIRKFLQSTRRPAAIYEVIVLIEHLRLPEEPVRVGEVSFMHLDATTVEAWGITRDGPHRSPAEKLLDRTVAVTRVEAGSLDKALELARENIDAALDVLRVALSMNPDCRIHDWQLLQKRGPVFVARRSSAAGTVSGWHREFTPATEEVTGAVLNATVDVLRRLEPVLTPGGFPPKLAARVLRALRRTGSSIGRDHFDDKITDLFTAMEALLTNRNDLRKAQAVAIRAKLLAGALGDSFPDVDLIRVFDLYDNQRSDLVHGSNLRITGEADYRALRRVVLTAVFQVIRLVQDRALPDHGALVAALETQDLLREAADWLAAQPETKTTRALRAYVALQLAHPTKLNQGMTTVLTTLLAGGRIAVGDREAAIELLRSLRAALGETPELGGS